MWVYQLDTLAFLAVNNAAVARYDYSRDEFLAMTLHDIRPEAERSRLAQHMDKAEQGSRSPGLWRHRRKDGWLMTVEISSHALAFGSRHTRLVLAHDVSEREAAAAEKEGLNAELDQYRHHLEELVAMRTAELAAKRRQAEKANRAKSHFLTNMSHEIRTPMNPIIGLNQLMRRDGATPEQVVRLDKIDSAGQHVLAIINDVLDVAKIEAGRVQLDNTDFDLGALLDNVLAIIAEPAHQKGLAVTVNTSGVPAWLHGDPTRLRQAWLNCASNAVKFTEQGSVAPSALLLQEDGDSLQLQFSVDDTGYGIAPEPLRRLFQDFEQADASTTRQYGGTGLGLAITRRLAQLMDGEVGAPSTLGAASRFCFTARLGRGQRRTDWRPEPAAAAVDAQTRHPRTGGLGKRAHRGPDGKCLRGQPPRLRASRRERPYRQANAGESALRHAVEMARCRSRLPPCPPPCPQRCHSRWPRAAAGNGRAGAAGPAGPPAGAQRRRGPDAARGPRGCVAAGAGRARRLVGAPSAAVRV